MNPEDKLEKKRYDSIRYRMNKDALMDKGKVYRKYTRLNINTNPDNNPQAFVSNVIEPVIVKPKTKAFDDYTLDEQTQLSYIRMNYGEAYYQQVIASYNG